MRTFAFLCLSGLLVAILGGCAASKSPSSAGKAKGAADEMVAQAKDKLRAIPLDAAQQGAAAEAPARAEPVPRKIIYTGRVEVLVDDFDAAARQVESLAARRHGYVAKSEVRGSPGQSRSGVWVLRVPVDAFDAVQDAVAALGEVRLIDTDSNDITDQFYDLQAHVKTNEVEEEGLRKLYLERSAQGKLEDLLAIRRELRDIRGKIEEQKGQLQRWTKQTELATLNVTLHERAGYVPPNPQAFSTSIGHTFKGSVDLLVDFGKALVLAAVAVGPWLPLLALVAAALWWLVRRHRRIAATLPTAELAEPPPAG